MIHVDVTKLKLYKPVIGTAFLHTVIDDHARVAYVEICSEEKTTTAIGVLERSVAWFAERGVIVERVLSDGSCYRSYAWRDACAALGISHKRTKPYRPRPTERANASTALWRTDGRTPDSMNQKPIAEQPCRQHS